MNRFLYLLFTIFFGITEILPGQVKIQPTTEQEAAAFGYHLAQDGDWLLIGAKDDTLHDVAGGAAYFYKRENDNWVLWQKVGADKPAAGDLFGISVDIDGDYAVIGADGDDELSVNSGAAYVFKRVDGYWQGHQKLLPQESGPGSSEMGIAVSMKNGVLVVGAYSDMTNGPFAGAAYIYQLEDNYWVLRNKVLPADGQADDKFGRSVHTDGQRVIICGVLNDDNGTNSGSAYIFSRMGDNWLETTKLLAPDAAENDRFGRSLAINGSYVAVGSVLDDDNGEQSGSVYIFREYMDGWRFEHKITPDDGQADDFFGYSLSFHNPYLLVGAHNDDDYGLNSGAAYLFKREGNNWWQVNKIYALDPATEANFGESVDLNNSWLALGAPYERIGNVSTGAAYIMESPVLTHLNDEAQFMPRVYPNPAANDLYIELPAAHYLELIQLYDGTGHLLYSWEEAIHLNSISLNGYDPGAYLLRLVDTDGKAQTVKIIKE